MDSAHATRVALILLAIGAQPACWRDGDRQRRNDAAIPAAIAQARVSWPVGVAAQVDSGNAAYGAQDYDRAAHYYRRATQLSPRVSAGWFGIYITEHARGNTAAADSAMQRARELAYGSPLQHAQPADTAGTASATTSRRTPPRRGIRGRKAERKT